MNGLIIKGIGGFYYVKTSEGVFQAKGRGVFKKEGIVLCVGDYVSIEVLDDGDAVINSIEPRKNHFIRPPIANVDAMIVVFAATKPKPNFTVIDKFLIMAEQNGIEPIICINKCDLLSEEKVQKLAEIYEGAYKVVKTSSETCEGLERLESLIKGKKVAFAGPSGVGKSTITNALIPEANMETGKISDKTSRGKHTTRHVEIFETAEGGYVFDTPGFTSFEIMDADEDNLRDFYPEIAEFTGKCRFDNCRHVKEPGCAVIEAVEEGRINKQRYESYLQHMDEIKRRKKQWVK